jgi:hypothetical protein
MLSYKSSEVTYKLKTKTKIQYYHTIGWIAAFQLINAENDKRKSRIRGESIYKVNNPYNPNEI